MAKKSDRKNRSARRRMQLQEELAKRNKEESDAQFKKEAKLIFSCLAAAFILLIAILCFI